MGLVQAMAVAVVIWMVLLPLASGFLTNCYDASCQQHQCGSPYAAEYGKCFCDDRCLALGDCCMDYITQCTDHNITDAEEALEFMLSKNLAPFTECIKISNFETELKEVYSMVTKCPEELDPLCDFKDGGTNDLRRVVPVFDETTELLYYNQYCARCHGVQTFKALNPQFECYDTTEAASVRAESGLKAFAEYLVANCKMLLDWAGLPVTKMDDEYSCDWRLEPLVQDCAKTSDANQTLYCKSYKAVVGVPGEWTYYRNKHCAFCNGFPMDDLECEYSQPGRPEPPENDGGLPSFGLLMDFSSKNGISDQITFSKRLVCPSTQYLDVLKNECVSRSCDSTEVLFEGQCTPLEMDFTNLVNVVPAMKEIHLLIRTDRQDTDITIFSYILSSYEELEVMIIQIDFADCASGAISSFFEPTNSPSPVCLEVALLPMGVNFLWPEMISFEVWDRVAFRIGDVTSMVLTTHKEMPPTCIIGELKWHQNFSLVTSDLVGLLASYSLLVPDLGRAYPIDSTAFLLEVGFSSGKRLVKYGLCELAVFTCDKITVGDGSYNVTNNNVTHAQLAVRSVDGQDWQIEAARSDFVVTNQGLVVCAEVLVNENVTVTNTSISKHRSDAVQSYLTTIGLSLSILCLLVTFIVHCVFPGLQKTIAGKLLMNICISLLFAQFLFLVSGQWSKAYVACKVLAAFQHYLWLVSFCWMNVFAVDVSMTFVNMKRGINSTSGQSKRMVGYACYAWGVPACLCFAAVCVDVLTDVPFTYGWETVVSASCWISPGQALLYAFGVPIGLILLINTACFVLTLVVFIQTRKQTQKATSSESNADAVLISVKLSTVMGFTWIFGFLANIEALWFLIYLFIIFNTLQGVFLFVSFICTKRMYRLMKHFVETGERVMSSRTSRTLSTRSRQADTSSSVTKGPATKGSVTNGPMTTGPVSNGQTEETKPPLPDLPVTQI